MCYISCISVKDKIQLVIDILALNSTFLTDQEEYEESSELNSPNPSKILFTKFFVTSSTLHNILNIPTQTSSENQWLCKLCCASYILEGFSKLLDCDYLS